MCETIGEFLKFVTVRLDQLLRPLGFGDVAHHGTTYGSPVRALRRGCLYPHPERRGILLQHSQLPRLWGARLQERFAVQIINVLVLAENKARQWVLDQSASFHAEQSGRS